MDSIEVKGRQYFKISIAAERTGYTRDYIGQLCRGKKIDAKLVGRTWYVDLEGLEQKRKEKTRSNFNKTKKAVQAQRELAAQAATDAAVPSYRERLVEEVVRYEQEQSEPLPPLRKLTTESTTFEESADSEDAGSETETDTEEETDFEAIPETSEREEIVEIRHEVEEEKHIVRSAPIGHGPREARRHIQQQPPMEMNEIPEEDGEREEILPRSHRGRARSLGSLLLILVVAVIAGVGVSSVAVSWDFSRPVAGSAGNGTVERGYEFTLPQLFDRLNPR